MALKAPALIGLCAAFAVAAIGINMHLSNIFSAERGADYLETKGYQNVTGGDRVYMFHTCAKDDMVRQYHAVKDNKKVTQNVCYTPLWGPYLPWF